MANQDIVKVEETTIDHCPSDASSDLEQDKYVGHKGTGSFFTAYFNVVCVVAGTGTLGLPRALALGGWLGLLILGLAWGMAIYGGIVLIRCLYYKPGQRLHDYKQVATHALGWVGYWVTAILHILNVFGCPTLYLVLAGQNMNEMLKYTNGALTSATWTIIFGCVLLIPMVTLKTMKEITIVSALGALCTAIAVFVVAIVAPMDAKAHPDPVKYAHDAVIWTGFPSALSTIAFSYGGINTYPHVEHAMAKPWQWNYAVATGLSTCSVLYFLTAVPGYWAYGIATQSPIYASLPEGTGKLVAMIVMTIHVVVAVPIYTTTFSLETQEWLRTEERFGPFGAWAARAAIRTLIMVIVVILAVYIPYFGDFMSLIGALTNCGLVFLLPVLCYLRLTGWRNKPIYELAWCALIVLLGVVGMIFGTIDAVKALVADFQAGQ
ncbi:hypothetical protein K450DRAFT_227824 [Umbelopsis ramanniana AG]|uniref:Amino acid transporter transmembrane domain-containing protein n=1 Tax=Umbelopsis ramanniana AG TaxID=1314678 RepID=A0AAD5EFU7_UMBRA|nr:uncharacterized protein K450DRAFT_227824 [Umbelopsis ramanniana AG]KAI8582582.1 hypothetical protein K450DRAFT_227824 [Umbelopsis ramanniana AG]